MIKTLNSLVDKPNIFCQVGSTGTQSIAHNTPTIPTTLTVVQTDTAQTYNTSTRTFKVPVSGTYSVFAKIAFTSFNGTSGCYITVLLNGGTNVNKFTRAATTGYTEFDISTIVQASAGDSVQLQITQVSNVTVTLDSAQLLISLV